MMPLLSELSLLIAQFHLHTKHDNALSSFLPMSSGWSVGSEGAQPSTNLMLRSQAGDKPRVKTAGEKPRAFLNMSCGKYLSCEEGKLQEELGEACYWVPQRKAKGSSSVYLENYQTQTCLSFNVSAGMTGVQGVESEWVLRTDEGDETGRRAVVMWSEGARRFLGVVEGRLEGLVEQTVGCRWYLESLGSQN